ncbi:MAG: DNA polymerase III subunit delta [Fimbriimonas sp.]
MSVAVQKLLKHRLVLLTGEEAALRREALEGLLAGLEMTKDDFDLEQFDGDSSTPIGWLGSVGTAPFLAPRRVAIVRHVLRCDFDKKGADLKTIPETGLLILVADDEGGSDAVQSKLKTADRNWRKAVEKAGGAIFEAKNDPKRTKDEVRKRLEASGKTMSDRALDMLAEMSGGSLSRALDELEKLVIFVGDGPQIREGDVRAIVIPSRDWNVFRMVDAIVAGEVGEALRQLRVLVGSAQKAENAAHAQIVPMVSRALRLLWQARVCVDAGVSPSNAPDAVRATFPEKPNLAAEQPYRQGPLMNSARRVSLERIERAMAVLSDTDARLKGALEAFTAVETLERMVLEMAEALAPTSARR